MRSVVALVAHPESNDVEEYAGLEQMHRAGVVLLLKWSHRCCQRRAETMSNFKATRLGETQCWRGLPDYTDA
jgi:hypothetical protein